MTESNDKGSVPRERLPWLGLVALVAILVVLTGIVVYSGIWRPEGDVAVPDLSGMELADARKALSEADLDIERVDRRQTKSSPENVVLNQTPSAASIVPRGSKVSLIVSTGIQRGRVPDVSKMELEEAAKAVQSAGYEVEVKSVVSAKVDPGAVVRQSPAAGKRSTTKSVTIYVAVGVGEDVETPFVIGLAQPAAVSVLEEAELKALSFWVADPGSDTRTVIGQYPPGGMLVAPGTVVQLTVNGGIDNTSLPTGGIIGEP